MFQTFSSNNKASTNEDSVFTLPQFSVIPTLDISYSKNMLYQSGHLPHLNVNTKSMIDIEHENSSEETSYYVTKCNISPPKTKEYLSIFTREESL